MDRLITKLKTSFSRLVNAHLLFSIVMGFVLAYGIAGRFTGFYMYTRQDKLLSLVLLFVLAGLLQYFFFFPLVKSLASLIPSKVWLLLALASMLLSGFLFLITYQFPAFPRSNSLEIAPVYSEGSAPGRGKITILAMSRVDLPVKRATPIELAYLDYGEGWVLVDNTLAILPQPGIQPVIKYARFMQGKIEVSFATGPSAGMVELVMNGTQSTINLVEPVEGIRKVSLAPTRAWQQADLVRKAFLAATLVTEFLLTMLVLIIIGLILYQVFVTREIRLRGVGTVAASIVISSALIVLGSTLQQEVLFADRNLEALIREQTHNLENPIYQHQLLTIAVLDAHNRQISNLEGIQALRNLRSLDLRFNTIEDVTPLASLDKLTNLDLSSNQMTSLEAVKFSSLVELKLETLGLSNNLSEQPSMIAIGLTDISILADLEQLKSLDLSHNRISDISPIAHLHNIEVLELGYNQIQDISPLAGLSRLTDLNIRTNQIDDLSPLTQLAQLQSLNLNSNTHIVNFQPLAELTALKELNLQNIPIGDSISVIADLHHLVSLDLKNCSITDFTVVSGLMAVDALQDKPDRGVWAEVSIRDNPVDLKSSDPFAPLRPYWQNISTRDPKNLPINASLASPVFSKPGGYYTTDLELTLSSANPGAIILYTLDGSEPRIENVVGFSSPYQISHIYQEPLKVKSRVGEPNVFSIINTASLVNEWLPLWQPPNGEVFKATVVRARAYQHSSGATSEIVTNTYFVDPGMFERYATLPVISLVSDYAYLFDPTSGIYTSGTPSGLPDPSIFFNESFVPANVEFYAQDGTLGFNGVYEIQLQGNTSRASPQKGLTVTANDWFGDAQIDYSIFKDTDFSASQVSRFHQFLIRAWGSSRNWPVIFSDAYHQSLLSRADQDLQAYRPAIVFINGEYWGLHELRESIKNSWYHQEHTGIDRIEPGYDLIDKGYDYVDEGEVDSWKALAEYVASHDLSVDSNYAYVSSQIDIPNFIHYSIHCIYTGKRDWPLHNESKWRVHSADGKWRWIQYDMDHGLSKFGRPEYDMVYHTIFDEAYYHPLLVKLLQNQQFKELFLNSFADDLNTYFLPSVEDDLFSKMRSELEPYLAEYQDRWQLNYDWNEGIIYGSELIDRRNSLRWNQVMTNFNLSEKAVVTIKTTELMGTVQVNSVLIKAGTPGVSDPAQWQGTYFKDIPIRLTALPKPGYRFDYWEINNQVHSSSQNITLSLVDDTIINAVFVIEH